MKVVHCLRPIQELAQAKDSEMNKQVKIYILRFTNTLGDTVKGRVVAGNGTLGTVCPGGSG